MKRFYLKQLLAALLLLCSAVVSAHDFEVDGIYYNITDETNKTVEVTFKGDSQSSYANEYSGNVIIPSSVSYNGNTYSVTSIGYSAFYGCTGLTSVEIPNSVTSIGQHAFSSCTGLTSITIPNSVTSIEKWAFSYCTGLTSVTIPNSVTTIGAYAFYNCTGLTSVTIPNSVTSIGEDAFYHCTGLTNVTIPNSVTSIGYSAFQGCTGLTSIVVDEENSVYDSREGCNAIIRTATNTLVIGCKNTTIPNSVTSIGDYAFQGCTGLTSITIPNSVTSIGDYAFQGCTSLTSITIPNSVTSIESHAFDGCSGLTSVTIPNSVTTIEQQAFSYCTGLTSVTIPNSVTTIGAYAFYNCTGLTSVTIPNSVTSIRTYAFYNCTGFKEIYSLAETPATIYSDTFNDYSATLYVPAGAKAAYQAANYWKNFTNIVEMTEEVDSKIDLGACGENLNCVFDNATNTLYITGTGKMTNYSSFTSVPWYDYLETITSVVIGDGVTSIGNNAFRGCTGLTSVTIPNSVTTIGNWTFYNCSGLTSVTIPNSVTSIGHSAFSGCSGLTSITIPNSVTTIESFAFNNCSMLKVVYNNSSLNITKGSSSNGYVAYYALAVITDENRDDYDLQGDYLFSTIDGTPTLLAYIGTNAEITLPENYNGNNYVVGEKAFYGCTSITSVTIPNSVTSIASMAFYKCSMLKVVYNNSSLNITKGSSSNGYVAYYALAVITDENRDDYDLQGDYLFSTIDGTPTLLAYIGTNAEITLPENYNGNNYVVGEKAFYDCTSITSIEIPGSVTSIGSNAFYNCSGLISIEIPGSVTSIGSNALYNCSGLTSITISSVNTVYDSRNNCNAIIETATNKLIVGCNNATIPNSVTSIESHAFYNCSGLTSVTIPNSVTSIGSYAFKYCSGLTSVTIPNSVTSIGSSAFEDCSNLTSVTMGNGVTSIGRNAFSRTGWYKNQPNGLLYLDGWLLGYKSLQPTGALTINEGTKGIADNAFLNCTGLTSVTIPNSVTNIGFYAFDSCTGLTSVTIGNSANIERYAFYACTALTSVTIGNSVTTIENYAFYGCTGLKEIYSLAEAPAAIYSYTFNDYSATLYIPTGAKAAYQAADYWKNFTNIVEIAPTEVTITISQYGTATYCSPYALDFSEVEGLKAYTATGYNTNTGVVTLTRTKSAIERTGLFLMGEPGEYTVPVIEQANDYMLNMLVGTLEETAINNKTDDGNYVNFKYTIGSESSQPMFYQFADGSVLSAGKAYLQLPASLFPSTASKSVSIRFDEGLTTDIDEVESEENGSQPIYDLSGRRVSKPAKGGIYIINGKKVVL